MKLHSYLTIAGLFVAALSARAQKPDTAQAIVHYKFTHVRDTLNRNKPYTENMLLLIGQNASNYKSYDYIQSRENMRKSVAEQISSGSTDIKIASTGNPGTVTEYFQYPNENKMFTQERLINNYLIQESMPALQWKISTDTASFAGLQCQKATTHFKGRDYVAWFCPDLPYRAGPWKLNGLPGLIVEAHDTKNEVIFKFDGLEKVDKAQIAATPEKPDALMAGDRKIMITGDDGRKNPNVISLPTNGIKVTPKELQELREIMRKDPQAFFQSQIAARQSQSGATMRVTSPMGQSGTSSGITSVNVQRSGAPSAVINNPIELPEKK